MSSKNTFYFSHDANAHEDDKIVCLMSKYGAAGYGWWWILVEILFQQEGCRIDLSKKSTIPYLYRMLWDMPIKKIPEFLEDLIEYELLIKEGDYVYSESLQRRSDKINELREKRRDAANARWNKKKPEKKAPKPLKNGIAVLNDKARWSEFRQELLVNDKYKVLGMDELDNEKDKCLNWLASKGAAKKDYKAFFRNWITKFIEDKGLKGNNANGMVY